MNNITSHLSSSTDETTVPAAKLPVVLDCIKCERSIHDEGGYVVSLSAVMRPDALCTAVCTRCAKREAA